MRYSASSISSKRARLVLTQLESREVPSLTPTNLEQEFLERLNDARANPAAYGQQIGVDLSYIPASAPLAFDTRLIQSARGHSQDMNDKGYFGHTGSDGSDPGQRMSAVGYPWWSWAESIAAGYSTPASALAGLIIDSGVPSLGHRNHLLSYGGTANHRDVGVGIVFGSGPYRYYYTIDSGYTSDTRPALTGVAYIDNNHNGKYDAGEGLSGVTVTVAGVGSTTTWSSGGYTFKLNPGSYLVTASGGGLPGPVSQQVTVGSANFRLNFTPDFSGPHVTASQLVNPLAGGPTVVRLNFTEPVDPTTFTTADVTIAGPNGGVTPTSVTAVAGSNNTQFDVAFPAQSVAGTYTLTVGPDVRDPNNNQMDQNGNGTNGEVPGDRYTTSFALPATVAIVNSLGAGYSAGSGWQAAAGEPANYYGGDTGYFLGAAASTANFTTAVAPGTYRVSATWLANANRPTNAQYTVVDASGSTLATRTLNQETTASDLQANGWHWADVGTVTLSSAGSLTVRIGGGQAGQYLDADAVRFELVSPPPPPPPPGAVTVVNSLGAGYAAGSGWHSVTGETGSYYGGDTGYFLGAATSAASFTASNLAAGTYRVSATWLANANRPTNAQYTVVDASGSTLATRTLNQETTASDLQADGWHWADIGTVTLSANGTLTVTLGGGQAGHYLDADAVRFEKIS